MIDPKYLDAIKRFEGFTPKAKWDYAQSTNGFGTRASFDGEVIDKAEAERRFKSEISSAFEIVHRFAPNLDEGTKAALTSLTFNAGPSWTRSGLGKAIQSGDLESARAIFQKYNRAGGTELAGLTSRRVAEATWFTKGKEPPVQFASALLPSQATTTAAALHATAPFEMPARHAFVPSGTARGNAPVLMESPPGRLPLTLDSVLVLLALLADSTTSSGSSDQSGDDQKLSARLLPTLA